PAGKSKNRVPVQHRLPRIARCKWSRVRRFNFSLGPQAVVELVSGIKRGARTDGRGEREKETACNRNRRGSTTLQETTGRRKRGNHVEGARGGVGGREGKVGGLSKAFAVPAGRFRELPEESGEGDD